MWRLLLTCCLTCVGCKNACLKAGFIYSGRVVGNLRPQYNAVYLPLQDLVLQHFVGNLMVAPLGCLTSRRIDFFWKPSLPIISGCSLLFVSRVPCFTISVSDFTELLSCCLVLLSVISLTQELFNSFYIHIRAPKTSIILSLFISNLHSLRPKIFVS